ncbi:hypothetical protein N9D82_02430 [Gammaproteobacteria bacterium]|nr:hypothetical protein [Gammaproteobacteria bacterium]
MKKIIELLGGLSIGGIGLFFFISYTVGAIYWIWMSIQLGSFFMFFLGIAGPVVIFTGPVGAYSLIFGVPDWVYNYFT